VLIASGSRAERLVRSEAGRLRASGASPDEAAATIDKDARARWNT